MIKVNLPDSYNAYLTGNGEGCWAECSAEVQQAYDRDESGTTYYVTLENDSIYYPGLMCGAIVPIEMRGEYRPVVPFEWLSARLWEAEA